MSALFTHVRVQAIDNETDVVLELRMTYAPGYPHTVDDAERWALNRCSDTPVGYTVVGAYATGHHD